MKLSAALSASVVLTHASVSLAAAVNAFPSVNPYIGRDVYVSGRFHAEPVLLLNSQLFLFRYLSPVYTKEILGAVKDFTKAKKYDLAVKALKVAQIPTFLWIAERAAVNKISGYLLEALFQNPKKPKCGFGSFF